jgi:hypothetical protein
MWGGRRLAPNTDGIMHAVGPSVNVGVVILTFSVGTGTQPGNHADYAEQKKFRRTITITRSHLGSNAHAHHGQAHRAPDL